MCLLKPRARTSFPSSTTCSCVCVKSSSFSLTSTMRTEMTARQWWRSLAGAWWRQARGEGECCKQELSFHSLRPIVQVLFCTSKESCRRRSRWASRCTNIVSTCRSILSLQALIAHRVHHSFSMYQHTIKFSLLDHKLHNAH